jgi:ATP phosphoribosyltransferase regulatory subunit HisZ
MVTLDQALDAAMQLPPDQQEMLIQILHNRRIESRREEIAQNAKTSIAEFHSGQLKPLTAEEAIAELRQSLNDVEAQ